MAETVAFLFSDVQGSTRLLSMLGTERYGKVLTDYRAAVERSSTPDGGAVVDREGDGLFLVFPTAVAALRAALRAQRAIAEETWPDDTRLNVRMGIHAGQAERHADGYVGLAVHRAARIASAAHGGQVLVSEAAHALAADDLPPEIRLRDLGQHRLKDLERREHLYEMVAPGLATGFPPPQTLDASPNNLPLQPTSFIGRDRELSQVDRLLTEYRLVTLTGVGGAGKSRLALQVAAQVLDRFPDGARLVELAAVTDPVGVVGQIAAALGIRDERSAVVDEGSNLQDRLVEHLRRRELLLVLDNCEHLLGATSELADLLLRSCPGVRILATSREGLAISGEATWRVPSMSLPHEDATTESSDAVRLFVDRARAVAPAWEATRETLPTIVQVCRRLDGIPLAIELAAARMRVLGVDQLASRLDDRFRLLTGGSRTALPRQQTLEATIDWSYQLLGDAERVLFARLSVFAGSFTLEAAEEVCAADIVDEPDVVDLVFQLTDKSLVAPVEAPGPARYRLLETLRQYARAKLVESAEADTIRRRHRDWALRLADRRWTELEGPSRITWLEEVEREHDNVAAALDWSVGMKESEAISTLAATLARHWAEQGHHGRAVELWREALAHAGADRAWEAELRYALVGDLSASGRAEAALDEVERARALVAGEQPSSIRVRVLARYANVVRSDVRRPAEEAIPPATEAVADARALGRPRLLSDALRTLGLSVAWLGDIDGGVAHLRESLRLGRQVEDRDAIAVAFGNLVIVLHDLGRRAAESDRLEEEVLDFVQDAPDATPWAFGLWGMIAYFRLRRGDWPGVEEILERFSRYHLEGSRRGWFLQVRGALRWMQGRLPEATRDAAELEHLGIARWNHDLFPLRAEIAAAEGRLDGVRDAAEAYFAQRVDAGEEVMKAAVLSPLVRAEVDAALAAGAADGAIHLQRAGEAARRIQDLLERYPPATLGAIQFEAPPLHRALAEAELSRATTPDPDLWEAILSQAWYAYTRLYARWRRGEALAAVGRSAEAASQLSAAYDEAIVRGAALLAQWCESIAARYELSLDAP